ncbi:MAG: hypothetical protein AAGD47_12425 [Pseudomonadota bacterium]
MLSVLEILVYLLLGGALWLAYSQIANRADGRRMLWIFGAGALTIAAVILSGVNWDYFLRHWRDYAANLLVALAILSVIIGYARLLRVARRRAEKKDEK